LSIRNNEDRFGAPNPDTDPPLETAEDNSSGQGTPLTFVVPTEFVELPSRGHFYPSNHPLHNEETVEIKFMTAKEEDILTSRSLLEKGIALDRMLANLVVDKRIKPQNLLSGDKNAILIAARKSGYGADYVTNITCPVCTTVAEYTYDLDEAPTNYGLSAEELKAKGVTATTNGTFIVSLPRNPVEVEFKLLSGREEQALIKSVEQRKKKKLSERLITDQLKLMIVSVNGYKEVGLLDKFVETMTLADTRFLRSLYQEVNPNVELKEVFVCDDCGHTDEIDFPFTTDFFWPQR